MPTAVSFYSQGLKLAGLLYSPANAKGRLPTIVLCQGLSGDKTKVLPSIAEDFAKAGFLVLAFDHRGCGESEGDRQRLFPLERDADIAAAIAYVRSLDSVDPERVALYGLSYGGAGCLYAASQNHSIKCVVSVSGAANGEDFVRGIRTLADFIAFKKRLADDRRERALTGKSGLISVPELVPFPAEFWEKYKALGNKKDAESIPEVKNQAVPMFTLESAEAMLQFNISDMVAAYLNCPTLIIHGEVDDIIALEDVRRFYNKLRCEKKLTVIPGKDHIDLDQGPGLQQQIDYSIAWFKQYL